MKIFFCSFICLIALQSNAQDSLNSTLHKDSLSKKTGSDNFFTKVQIESHYPGGDIAWTKFLNANLHYPEKAARKKIQGTVVVQFIVEKNGMIDSVLAVSGPEKGGLREEAVRVITISGKWTPAFQNGISVRSQKKQPLIFKLEE